MSNQISESGEARFITKEFAETIAGKTPSPYLRLHDPAQKMLADLAAATRGQPLRETAYTDRMIHFWREVSLAGLPRAGRGMDECYALLFEATFDLAEAEPDWAVECLDQKTRAQWPWEALSHLARSNIGNPIAHGGLVEGFASLYAPWRERDEQWKDACCVVAAGGAWFWAALLAAAGVAEDHRLWNFRWSLAQSSSTGWSDNRLHARLIRGAPRWADTTPRIELMDHPILRMARLKYAEGSVEQKLVLRFLNQRCIREGLESETDYFDSHLTLAQWARDARVWAAEMRGQEPETCAAMFEASGAETIDAVRKLFRSEIGLTPSNAEHLDAAIALIRWAKRRRGFEISDYRAQLWEFVVEIVDAALWLGWLFPRIHQKLQTVPGSARNRE